MIFRVARRLRHSLALFSAITLFCVG
jgi:hypothetical protein